MLSVLQTTDLSHLILSLLAKRSQYFHLKTQRIAHKQSDGYWYKGWAVDGNHNDNLYLGMVAQWTDNGEIP